jgi:hypothetical protein
MESMKTINTDKDSNVLELLARINYEGRLDVKGPTIITDERRTQV